MGIPKFYGDFLKKRYSSSSGILVNKLPDETNISSFSLDMNSLFHEISQLSFKESNDEQKFFELLSAKIIELIVSVNPTDLLILAVDGVAPMSKIIQQRSRRYKSILREKNPNFDSNSITPGTDFMIRLDNYLSDWITNDLSKTFKFKIIYSSHLVPGEGEHKIMDYIRAGLLKKDGVHVIYGMDADLIVLSLISGLDHVFLLRQDIEDIIDIGNLRKQLLTELTSDNRPEAIFDFAIMSFFVGSDFLPVSPGFENLSENLNNMILKYRRINLQFTNRGSIIWPNFSKFLKSVSESEEYFLTKESRREKKLGFVLMDKSMIEGKFNYSKFRTLWYKNEFENKGQTKLDFQNNITVDMIFGMCSSYLDTINWIIKYYIIGNSSSDQLFYYRYNHSPLIKDVVSSIYRYSKLTQSKPDISTLNPVYQLICVIPPHSFNILPSELNEFLKLTECLRDMLPEKFTLEVDGKNAEWQGIPLLPFPDIRRIISCITNSNMLLELMERLSSKEDLVLN